MTKNVGLTALALCLIASPVFAQEESGSGAGVNYEMRLSTIENELRSMNGKVEQVDYAVRRMEQAVQRMQADSDARLTRLEQVVQAQQAQAQVQSSSKATAAEEESVVTPEVAAATTATGQLGDLKVRGGKVAGAVANPKSTPLPDKPDDYGLTSQELYDRAFGLLRQASYDEAEKVFGKFIEKYPQDKLIENAKYWHAETFYVRGKFNDAAVAFADAFQQNPKGAKAPDSLLKLGMSLASLGKKDDACTTYASLKKNFPNSAQTLRMRADQERARLKCK